MKNAIGAVIVVLAVAATPVAAGFPGDVPDRLQVSFGGMVTALDTQASAGKTRGGLGMTIKFEDFFNMPSSNWTGFLNGSWRFAGRQYIDFGWLNIDRSGSRMNSEDVEFRDYTFLAGSELEGGLDSSFPYLAYRYDFLQLDQVKISGSAGISYIDLTAWLAADAGVIDPEGNLIEGYRKAEMSIGLPVPVVGFELDWAVSKRNSIVMSGRMIYANFSGLRAQISENSFHWYYHPWKHWALGAGFDRIAIGIPSYEKDGQFATFSYNLTGLAIFGKASF